MWKYYNPNPIAARVGDCSVRAISKAIGKSWEDAYVLLADEGLRLSDMPSANHVWGAVLKKKGFSREVVPNACPDCYTVYDFCIDHPIGVYVVATNGHVLTVCDGDYFDSWDSGSEVPIYFWKRVKR